LREPRRGRRSAVHRVVLPGRLGLEYLVGSDYDQNGKYVEFFPRRNTWHKVDDAPAYTYDVNVYNIRVFTNI